MAGFFNPNVAFDPNKPQDFDYQSHQQKLAMMKALADRMGQPLDQGRMVGGWYAGPSKGATIASALQQALAGYMSVKGMQGQQQLDKADREAMNAARKQYQQANDPTAFVAKAQEAHPIPEETYLYARPERVGPPDPNRSYPVDMGPGAAPAVMNPNSVVEVKGQRPDPFEVTPPNPEEVAAARANQVKFLQRSMAAEREAALDRLSRTKSGGPLAQAILARDYAPIEWVRGTTRNGDGSESDYFYNKNNPNQRMDGPAGKGGLTPYQQEQISIERERLGYNRSKDERDYGLAAGREARESAKDEREASATAIKQAREATDRDKQINVLVGGLDHAIRQIDELTPMAGKATGVLGKTMNALSEKTGIATDSKVARARIESVKGSLLAQSLAMQKQTAGTASGMSERESLAAQAAIAAIDPDAGEAELKKQLAEARRFLRLQRDRVDVGRSLDTPASAAPAAGSFKVPARGQRVTSPEDYGF